MQEATVGRAAAAARDSCAAASEPCFDDVVRRHHDHVRALVYRAARRVGWRLRPEDAEDLVQEVYCRLLAAGWGSRVDWAWGQLTCYQHRAARSVVIDELRRRTAQKRSAETGPPISLELAVLDARATDLPSPEQGLIASQQEQCLYRRLRSLVGGRAAERNFRILALALFEGLSGGEIAAALGHELTISSIHTVLCRLRQELAALGRGEVLGTT